MEEEQKSTRGGKREGAGRKKGIPNTGAKTLRPHKPSISITGHKEELERLKTKAAEANANVSAFVLGSLGCLNSQN